MSSVGSGSGSVDCRIAVSVHCGADWRGILLNSDFTSNDTSLYSSGVFAIFYFYGNRRSGVERNVYNKREGGEGSVKRKERGGGRTADVSIGLKYQPPTARAMTRTLKA